MRQLSIRQTVAIWGGVSRGRSVTRTTRAMDVTSTVRRIDPAWQAPARVAAVHIGVEKFFWDHTRGSAREIRREIIEARDPLKQQGYTHIAVTGPFLIIIRQRKRLSEISTFQNARAVSTPICALYRARIAAWSSVSRNQTEKHTKRLVELDANATLGFREHALFEI